MIELSVKSNIQDVIRSIGKVPKEIVVPAANRALNKAGKKAESQAVKRIADITNIKPQRIIRENIVLYRSNFATLRVRIQARRKGINLIEFVAPSMRHPGAFSKRLKGGEYKYQGVKAKAWGKQKVYKGTFIARGQQSGKVIVLARTGEARKPVKAIKGPSIRATFIQRHFREALLTLGRDVFITEFDRDVRYRLQRL